MRTSSYALASLGIVLLTACRAAQFVPPAAADTLRARNFEVVDEAGRVRMRVGMDPWRAPVISFVGIEGEGLAYVGLIEAKGPDGSEQRDAFILHAEAGDAGLVTLAVHDGGSMLSMGSDETDGLLVELTKAGLEVSFEPQHPPITEVGGPGRLPAAEPHAVEGTQGVRIFFEGGQLIVRDWSGRELARLGQPAASPKAP